MLLRCFFVALQSWRTKIALAKGTKNFVLDAVETGLLLSCRRAFGHEVIQRLSAESRYDFRAALPENGFHYNFLAACGADGPFFFALFSF